MIPRGREVKRARMTMVVVFATTVMFCLAFAIMTYDFDNLSLTDQQLKGNTASVNVSTDKGM